MVQTPQVQSLEQIMAELNPAFAPQSDVIAKKQAGLGAKTAASQAGLDATKAQAMNTINTQVTGKGMAFSGIPADEQATYLSTAYMPAVANLKAAEAEQGTALEQQQADLFAKKYTSAYDTRGKQLDTQNQWNLSERQNEFNAAEAAKARSFSASQAAAERESQKQEDLLSPSDAAQAIASQYMMSGGDMNPQVFQLMKRAYINAGGDKNTFNDEFWNLVPAETGQKEKAYYYR